MYRYILWQDMLFLIPSGTKLYCLVGSPDGGVTRSQTFDLSIASPVRLWGLRPNHYVTNGLIIATYNSHSWLHRLLCFAAGFFLFLFLSLT